MIQENKTKFDKTEKCIIQFRVTDLKELTNSYVLHCFRISKNLSDFPTKTCKAGTHLGSKMPFLRKMKALSKFTQILHIHTYSLN